MGRLLSAVLVGMLWVAGAFAAENPAPVIRGGEHGSASSPPPLPMVVVAPTQVVVSAPLALTHAHYAWTQTEGAPLVLPAETGATARLDVPAVGSYAWEVTAGDGRTAQPPVTVRLIVLADAAQARWAVPYPERLALRPGDRFAIDLRGVTAVPPPAVPLAAPQLPSPPAADWSRHWTVVWAGIAAVKAGAEDGGAADRLTEWTAGEPLGPRVRLFRVPPEAAAGVYTLAFRLVLNPGTAKETELHSGAVRLELAPPPGNSTVPAGTATTQVIDEPVATALDKGQAGPGAPVIALPYGDATVSVRLNEALDLDGRLCTDPDGDKLTFHWWHTRAPWEAAAAVRGTTSFTVLDHPALWRWQPTRQADLGLHEFVLSVSDGKNLVYSGPVRVKVEPAAATPTLQLRVSAGPQQVVEVGREVKLEVKVEQFDHGVWLPRYAELEPRWAQKTRPPGVLRVEATEPLSAFQPFFRADAPGLYELEFSVAAGEKLSNTVTVRVQVVAPNRPPTWLFEATPTVSGMVGEPLTLELPARDPDGDALKFELRRLESPAGAGAPALLDPAAASATVTDGVATVKVALPAWSAGQYVIGAAVSDGQAFSPTREALVWVREAAEFGPFLLEGPTAMRVGEAAFFRVTGAGAEGCFARWRLQGADARFTTSREGPRVQVLCNQAGTVELQAVVADGLGRAAPVTLAIQVLPAGGQP